MEQVLTGKPFTGDKCTWPEPAICFYDVEDYDKSDSVDDAIIDVKIHKVSLTNNQNTNNLACPVIKSFDYKGRKVVCVLGKMAVSIFEHLWITT